MLELERRAAVAEIVAAIWRAAVEPRAWDDALAGVGDLIPGYRGGTAYTPTRQTGAIWAANRAPEGFVEAYAREWGQKDIALHALMRRLPVEHLVFTMNELVPRSVLESSEIWRYLYVPESLKDAAGMIVNGTGGEATIFVAYGEAEWAPADEAWSKSLMQELRPHVSGAVTAHWRLVRAEQEASVSRYALDELTLGILWIDSEGRVLEANRSARVMLAAGDGLALRSGVLELTSPDGQQSLAAAVAATLRGCAEAPFSIGRPSGRLAYSGIVLPAEVGAGLLGAGRTGVMLFLTDPTSIPVNAAERVARLYGFTKAETTTAQAIAQGHTVEKIAAARRVSVNTVRTQIKSLMAKLGASRQSEVVRAVLAMGLFTDDRAAT